MIEPADDSTAVEDDERCFAESREGRLFGPPVSLRFGDAAFAVPASIDTALGRVHFVLAYERTDRVVSTFCTTYENTASVAGSDAGDDEATASITCHKTAQIPLAYADSYEPRADDVPSPWAGGVTT